MAIDGGGVVQKLLRALDLSGVAANAMLGGAVARAERLDPVGFVVLAIMLGVGGGMIRDTLLQHGPPVALTDYAYLVTALAAAAVAIVIRFEGALWERMFPTSMGWRWAAGLLSACRRARPSGWAGCPRSCSAPSPRWAEE
jgi:uncharacterized membrane protein YeiH